MNEFLTLKEVSTRYRISLSSLYRLARGDPGFPAINVGVRKKIIINQFELERWISKKNFKEELVRLPSNTIFFRRKIYETTKHQY